MLLLLLPAALLGAVIHGGVRDSALFPIGRQPSQDHDAGFENAAREPHQPATLELTPPVDGTAVPHEPASSSPPCRPLMTSSGRVGIFVVGLAEKVESNRARFKGILGDLCFELVDAFHKKILRDHDTSELDWRFKFGLIDDSGFTDDYDKRVEVLGPSGYTKQVGDRCSPCAHTSHMC